MQVKLVQTTPAEKTYAVVFLKGDEALSGMVEFARKYHANNAHFTAIGAVSSATLGWLDLSRKVYVEIPVREQAEVASLTGDIATFQGKPIIHMHAVLSKRDGTTVGGHIWELNVNPTLEFFVTVNSEPLRKRADDASGMRLIDPAL
jgi:predicted DNA-binding protein with PD1-like motif